MASQKTTCISSDRISLVHELKTERSRIKWKTAVPPNRCSSLEEKDVVDLVLILTGTQKTFFLLVVPGWCQCLVSWGPLTPFPSHFLESSKDGWVSLSNRIWLFVSWRDSIGIRLLHLILGSLSDINVCILSYFHGILVNYLETQKLHGMYN